jgi:hypothetical protein
MLQQTAHLYGPCGSAEPLPTVQAELGELRAQRLQMPAGLLAQRPCSRSHQRLDISKRCTQRGATQCAHPHVSSIHQQDGG